MIDRRCRVCKNVAAPNRLACEEHLAKGRAARARYVKTDKGRANRVVQNAEYSVFQRGYRRGKGRFYYVKQNAVRVGKEWTLTAAEYEVIISMPCDYCGLPNDVEAGAGLDRLDNSRGYHIDNVVSCCSDCNYARRHKFTPQEMKIIGAAIREVKLARRLS